MRVAVAVTHFAALRNFEPVIRELASRGHAVHVAAEEIDRLGGEALIGRLAAEYPAVTWGYVPALDGEAWHRTAAALRIALDYVRFRGRRYRGSPKLRRRYRERTPRLVLGLLRVLGAELTRHLLTAVERLMPRSAASDAYWRQQAPDVLLLTALTVSRSAQIDYLKSAQALGIPTAACIASWDHLSSKALVHLLPDRVIVWNGVQRREAEQLHDIPGERVVVTGAQCYDAWFDRAPERTYEAFCRSVGLRPDRPFVLYVCSALTPSPVPPEPVFVRQWITALRAVPELREVGVLVRPHPERRRDWQDESLEGLAQVAFHGDNPIDAAARRDYFESLYYSSAVVGIVTSAFLEASLIGRPVLTILTPEYRAHQEEMVHFRYLTDVEGGILQTAQTLDEHARQLREAVAQAGRTPRNRSFLETFIRPFGLDVAATPLFVAAVEQLASEGSAVPQARSGASGLERVVARLADATASTRAGQWLLMDGRAVADARIERQKARQLAARQAAGAARRREETARLEALVREKERHQRVKQRLRRWRQARHDTAVGARRVAHQTARAYRRGRATVWSAIAGVVGANRADRDT